ncbi:MAG TPA: hypothetical protein VLI69_05875, partial [Gammaproteobacteria bacterium]|nr:hypothetical protein [Gammaproteobacteria bacterium]
DKDIIKARGVSQHTVSLQRLDGEAATASVAVHASLESGNIPDLSRYPGIIKQLEQLIEKQTAEIRDLKQDEAKRLDLKQDEAKRLEAAAAKLRAEEKVREDESDWIAPPPIPSPDADAPPPTYAEAVAATKIKAQLEIDAATKRGKELDGQLIEENLKKQREAAQKAKKLEDDLVQQREKLEQKLVEAKNIGTQATHSYEGMSINTDFGRKNKDLIDAAIEMNSVLLEYDLNGHAERVIKLKGILKLEDPGLLKGFNRDLDAQYRTLEGNRETYEALARSYMRELIALEDTAEGQAKVSVQCEAQLKQAKNMPQMKCCMMSFKIDFESKTQLKSEVKDMHGQVQSALITKGIQAQQLTPMMREAKTLVNKLVDMEESNRDIARLVHGAPLANMRDENELKEYINVLKEQCKPKLEKKARDLIKKLVEFEPLGKQASARAGHEALLTECDDFEKLSARVEALTAVYGEKEQKAYEAARKKTGFLGSFKQAISRSAAPKNTSAPKSPKKQ